ncbi:MAG: DNA replication and repair protein RecF, partial [Gammaproteobacteria bacterium]|nr:DNA replication and repair protein RecF [Gammaproteobacteria bacterium]
LKQRNAALRNQVSFKEIDIWTQELILYGEQLERLRCDYLQLLIPLLENTIVELLGLSELKINYYRGWDHAKNYQDFLSQAFNRDMELGYTQFGPHKADLKLTIKGVPGKDILSRGQQKLFVCGMILARGMLLKKCVNKNPIYLVDDLPSELDKTSRISLMTLLSKQNAQIFVTAIECINENIFLVNNSLKMFHVEQGNVKEVF